MHGFTLINTAFSFADSPKQWEGRRVRVSVNWVVFCFVLGGFRASFASFNCCCVRLLLSFMNSDTLTLVGGSTYNSKTILYRETSIIILLRHIYIKLYNHTVDCCYKHDIPTKEIWNNGSICELYFHSLVAMYSIVLGRCSYTIRYDITRNEYFSPRRIMPNSTLRSPNTVMTRPTWGRAVLRREMWARSETSLTSFIFMQRYVK